MELNLNIDKFKQYRYNFFKWRYELNIVNKIILALAFAGLTGLMAQARLYLPFSPVPITGQTFAVMLCAIVLGKWGGVSQGMYLGIGAAGVPWFADFTGGIGVLTGATGGYIIGFVFAAFFIGYLVDKHIRSRSFFSMIAIMLFANFAIIYSFGLTGLYLWFYFVMGIQIAFWKLLTLGMIPFIIGDILKIFTASAIAKGLTPKQAFNGEVDVQKFQSWRIP